MTHAERYLKEELNPGETLLWSGRPANIKTFEQPHGKMIILRFVISAALLAFAVWYWFFAAAQNFEINLPLTMTFIMVAISAYLCIKPFSEVSRLKKRCLYAITDRRAMIVYNTNPSIARCRELSESTDASYELLSSGCGNVYVGKKCKSAPRKARALSLSPIMDDDDLPLIFHSVENPAAVLAHLAAPEKEWATQQSAAIA